MFISSHFLPLCFFPGTVGLIVFAIIVVLSVLVEGEKARTYLIRTPTQLHIGLVSPYQSRHVRAHQIQRCSLRTQRTMLYALFAMTRRIFDFFHSLIQLLSHSPNILVRSFSSVGHAFSTSST